MQQEKQKLNTDAQKTKKTYDQLMAEFDGVTAKFESATKEKMLMKLEKDRLIAKVDNLGLSLKHSRDEQNETVSLDKTQVEASKKDLGKKGKAGPLKVSNEPTPIPTKDRFNPFLNESFEAGQGSMSLVKTLKGHLMGLTSISYNPKKDIVATSSDDTTWKLWSVPNGDLIMSGEGHLDWVGGVAFHPRGNLLASASGDGTVKIWDFVNERCA